MKKTGILPYAAGVVMAVFFGLSFLVTQQGLAEIPPMVLMSFRFAPVSYTHLTLPTT